MRSRILSRAGALGVIVLSLSPSAAGDGPVVDVMDAGGGGLRTYHEALAGLEDRARVEPVRVVVYGDSNLVADRLTGSMRRTLQARHGDAGHGFVAFGDPWPGYRHQNVRSGHSYGLRVVNSTTERSADRRWGFAGIAVEANEGSSVWVGTSPEGPVGGSVGRIRILYLCRPSGPDIDVEVDGDRSAPFSTTCPESRTAAHSLALPDGPHEVRLTPRGHVRLYGAILERERPGVVVDSVGIGALSTYNLLHLDRGSFVEQLALRRPDLVVLTMGTNDQSADRLADQRRALVERIREAAPAVSILMLSPLDHARWKNRVWTSEARMLHVARALGPIAAENGTAFWDLYEAMGGRGSMPGWVAAGLVDLDGIHYRQELADRMAGALIDALDRDHGRWRRARLPAPTPAPAAAPTPRAPAAARAKSANCAALGGAW